MRLPRQLALWASLLATTLAADQEKYSNSVKLTYQVVGSTASAKPLAEVLYDPVTLNYMLASWTPPTLDGLKSTSPEPTSAELIRILTPDGSSTVTTLNTFANHLSQNIDLWLSPGIDGTIFSASISSISPPPPSEEEKRQKRKEERARAKGKPIPSPKPKPKSKSKKTKEVEGQVLESGPAVRVNLFIAAEGPQPKLLSRKPPVVNEQGQEVPSEEEVPKSFFQKYWYIFVIATVVMMGTGGGADK